VDVVPRIVLPVAYLAALWWLFEAPAQGHRAQFVVASLALPWAASTALLWIARPAADAVLPELTSRRALIVLAVGVLSAAFTGWHALLLLAATLLAVRIGMGLSYQRWGGIRAASLAWVRESLAVAILLIARLPAGSL
jgi:hypothetical protein